MANPGAIAELASTTYKNHKKKLADNVSNHNALHKRLTAKGRAKSVAGGLTLVCPLDYQENSTFQRYSGYDTLNVAASDVLTSAEYEWKQSAVHIAANGREIRINSGSKDQILDLVMERINNANRTAKNNMSNDIYSDGTSANQINGLQAICPSTAGGTLGGIAGSNYTFWQNKIQKASAALGGGTITLSETTFEKFMRQLYIELSRGSDKPDLCVLANNYYELFEGSQVSIKRYTTDADTGQGSANAGLVSLKYKNMDVFHDGGSGITASTGYMLNTDYLELCYHPDANWTEVEEQRAVNQDGFVIPLLWQGNIRCSNRSFQGYLGA